LIKHCGKNKVGSCGPINSAVQSAEVTFGKDLDYPYTFAAIAANYHAKPGGFSLQVFSKDKNMKMGKLN